MTDKKFLHLTYNSSLQTDNSNKVKSLGLENIKVFTYHGLAVKYYSRNAYTDTELRSIVDRNIPPKMKIEEVDIIVIDETQDMTDLYFHFLVKFLKDMGSPILLLVLGDDLQCLYEFKGADPRYLTMADKVWREMKTLKTKEFSYCKLETSYRITNQMSSYVNDVMLGYERMKASREGEPVTYVVNSQNNIDNFVIFQIGYLIQNGESPGDIFVLAGSVKGTNSQINSIENVLVERGIPCHIPMMDQEKVDDKVIEGKIVFSTFHCVKGRERKYTFIVGFDSGYFKYYARNIDTNTCPNTLYVGATRATKQLFLLEYNNQQEDETPLEFLKMKHYEMKSKEYVRFKGTPRNPVYVKPEGEKVKTKTRRESPTSLIRFIPDKTLDVITPIIFKSESDNIIETGELEKDECMISLENEENINTNRIEIPCIIKTNTGYEDVSDLNSSLNLSALAEGTKIDKANTEDKPVNIHFDFEFKCLFPFRSCFTDLFALSCTWSWRI
jgi:hypothetical protein